MRVLVPIKLNLDTSQIKFDERTGEPIYEAIPKKIGDADKCALEEALKLKESVGASVTVVTIGYSKDHQRIIRDAYAMGADEGYIIKMDGWDVVANISIANILKIFIDKHGPYDVILMGQWSNDTHSSVIHSILAGLLDYPLIPGVDALEFKDGSFRGVVNMEDGVYVFESSPPVIISVSSEANLPRIPTLKDILKAKRKEIVEEDISNYKVDYESVDVTSVSKYAVERKKIIFEVDDEEKLEKALDTVIDVLKGEGIL